MQRGLLILFAGVFLTIGAVSEPTPCIYVSTAGNDAWTGRLPEPNATTTDGPLASLQQAQHMAREILADEPDQGVRIYVRRGTYVLDAPLVFGRADAGDKRRPAQWCAYAKETPVITSSAASPLLTFEHTSDIILKGFSFQQLSGSGIHINHCDRMLLAGNTFTRLAGDGVVAENCSDLRVTGNDFLHVDSVPLRILNAPPTDNVTPDQIDNNQFYQCGSALEASQALVQVEGDFNRISHNRFLSSTTSAVQLQGAGCQVLNNQIIGTENGISMRKGRSDAPVMLQRNYFKQIASTALLCGAPGDDATTAAVITDTIIYKVHDGAVKVLDGAVHLSLKNSCFINAFPVLTVDNQTSSMRHIRFANNIITGYARELNYFRLYDLFVDDLSGIELENQFFDYPMEFLSVRWKSGKDAMAQHYTLTAWQSLGFDAKSRRIPPSYFAPDLEDFEVRADALVVIEQHFTPFPTFQYGLYEDEFRASWPPLESDAP